MVGHIYVMSIFILALDFLMLVLSIFCYLQLVFTHYKAIFFD